LDRQRGTAFGNGSEFLAECSASDSRADANAGRLEAGAGCGADRGKRSRCGYVFSYTRILTNLGTSAHVGGEGQMKELIEAIAKALVDNPDQVSVRAVEGEQVTVLELRVHPSDLGKVIGKQGRTARSVRTILNAAGMKLKKRFTLEILE
jgi:hypothetical protein